MGVIENLRAAGLRMGTVYASREQVVLDEDGAPTEATITVRRFVSWTTDETKANAAADLGASVRHYKSTDERFSGWEVTANVVEDSGEWA